MSTEATQRVLGASARRVHGDVVVPTIEPVTGIASELSARIEAGIDRLVCLGAGALSLELLLDRLM